jgi:hypothetical protein
MEIKIELSLDEDFLTLRSKEPRPHGIILKTGLKKAASDRFVKKGRVGSRDNRSS